MAKVAELKAKVPLLERKQVLKNEMEKLHLQEELIIAQAGEQAFIQIERELKHEATTDGMDEYQENTQLQHEDNLPCRSHEGWLNSK